MKRALILLTLLLFTFRASSQSGGRNDRPQECAQWDQIKMPPTDLPTERDRANLAGCDSEDLYFGFDSPTDPVPARKCAYLEREGGDAPVFGGSAMLMMIYANGRGAERNFDLALKFACEVQGAPAEYSYRIHHLLRLQREHWAADDFSLCDDITSGFMQGVCAGENEKFKQISRSAKLDSMIKRWTPAEKKAFAELQTAADSFFETSSRGEVDLSGTGRAAFVTNWAAWLNNGFVAAVERCEKGQLPNFSPTEFKKADEELNEFYADIQHPKPASEGMGTVTPEDIRTAERAWLVYREAWVKFGQVRYPSVKAESWRTWLTYDRTLMLHSIPGPQAPEWTAFQEYLPWRYQYDLGDYREAIRLKPDWSTPHDSLGLDLAAKGDRDGAMKEYREAIRLDPDDADGHQGLAFNSEKKEDWDNAVKEYREVVRLRPKDDIWRSALARALEGKGDLDGAIEEYREAIRLDPDGWVAYGNLGDLLVKKQDWDGAIQAYRQDLSLQSVGPVISSQLAEVHNSIGDALAGKKDWDGAIKEYGEVVRLTPKDADAHGNLGWALLNKKDWDGAIKEYGETLRLKPNATYVHYGVAWAFVYKHDWDSAIREYRELIRLKPDLAEAHSGLCFALAQNHDPDAAITECHEALRLKPDFAGAHLDLGTALYFKGDLDGAIREDREALRLQPDMAAWRTNLGYLLYKKGDLDGAITEERAALRQHPDASNTHAYLGLALAGKGDVDAGLAECREALRLDPNDSDAHGSLANVLEHKGDKQAALDEYRQASELGPKDSDYRAAYERLRVELKK